MNYVNVKVTVWNRLKFTDDADMQQIISLLQTGDVDSIFDDELGFLETATLYETEEGIEASENGNQATIEVFNGDTLCWENSGNS